MKGVWCLLNLLKIKTKSYCSFITGYLKGAYWFFLKVTWSVMKVEKLKKKRLSEGTDSFQIRGKWKKPILGVLIVWEGSSNYRM